MCERKPPPDPQDSDDESAKKQDEILDKEKKILKKENKILKRQESQQLEPQPEPEIEKLV